MPLDWDTGGFEAFLDGIVTDVEGALPFTVARAAEHVRAVAAQRAPIREGHLRASAGISVGIAGRNVGIVTFPGPYARYQEYTLDLHHPQGGQALYLTSTMVTERDACLQIMADTIREAMG